MMPLDVVVSRGCSFNHQSFRPLGLPPLQVLIVLLMDTLCEKSKKPLTRVSKSVLGVHGKRGLERGWQKNLF